jgi:uncharacterized protein
VPNPFLFDRPLPPADLIDREPELRLLEEMAEAGQSTRLSAPRRYGKTTLLRALAARLRPAWLVAHADFSGVVDVADAALRLRQAWAEAIAEARRPPRDAVRLLDALNIEVEVGLPGARLRATRQAGGMPVEALHDLLSLPTRIGKRRALVIFDEFSELLTAGQLEGIVRSHVQRHTGQASYCFAGSQMSVMTSIFGDTRRPLFAQARSVDLKPLPREELISWLRARDPELPAATAAALADRALGHPQRAMLIAHFLWEQPHRAEADLAAALEAAVHEARPEVEQIRDSLSIAQRRVLGAAGRGHRRLLSAAVLSETGLAKSTAQAARDALVDRGLLRIVDDGHALVDPFAATA